MIRIRVLAGDTKESKLVTVIANLANIVLYRGKYVYYGVDYFTSYTDQCLLPISVENTYVCMLATTAKL